MKKEELFVLIKALSRNEKRYFKLFCTREASGENYLRLFNAMDKQTAYDEKAIKERFKGAKFVKQLHVTKHYLRRMILKSLRNFHAQLSKDAEVKDILRNIEILYNKELFTHCETELKKADAIARKFELNTNLVEALTWKRKLEQAIRPHSYETFRDVIAEQQETIACLHNNNQYWQLAIATSMPGREGQIRQPKHADLLDNIENARTLEARVLHYSTAYFRYLRNRQYDQAENAMFELLAMFEKQPHRMQEDADLYASSINNLLSYFVYRKKRAEALKLVGRAKSAYDNWTITAENKTLLRQVLRTYNMELEIYRDARDFDRHIGFIDRTEAFITANRHKMPREYRISFWFQLANIHFMRSDFTRSLRWINLILGAKFKETRTDLHIHARMLNLMLHLEQRNLFVLRYFVDSTRRFIRKFKPLDEHEKILLTFFSRISNAPLLEYKDRFAELHRRLFPPDADTLLPPDVLDYIDYKDWIEGKLNRKQ